MSSHFSANQYEDAFKAKKLKNWTVPRTYKERPDALEGFTQIIATDRGHLKGGVPRSSESPWGTFMGTWDMPRNIPPVRPSYTARSARAADNLRAFKHNSTLNEAINGYKPFVFGKQKKTNSSVDRPKTPSPPQSTRLPQNSTEDGVPGPSGVTKTPPPRKTPTPNISPRGSSAPSGSHPGTPVRMMEKSCSPVLSVRSDALPATPDSGLPESRKTTPERHSVECC